ncbi:hypothetical protein BB559_004031, partial [Furculomyces boomerangus]
DNFVFRDHLVIVNELLGINLYEYIKSTNYVGLSVGKIQHISRQLLGGLEILDKEKIVHSDLKPENIMIVNKDSMDIKIIDFGSATFESGSCFSYIQSRFYRSIEVVMGIPYTCRIDMWSLGCIVAEMFLGLPLFPASSEHDLLIRVFKLLGVPVSGMVDSMPHEKKQKYFVRNHSCNNMGYDYYPRPESENSHIERYINIMPHTVANARKSLNDHFQSKFNRRTVGSDLPFNRADEYNFSLEYISDFLANLLVLDSSKRLSPQNGLSHPFITTNNKHSLFKQKQANSPYNYSSFQKKSLSANANTGNISGDNRFVNYNTQNNIYPKGSLSYINNYNSLSNSNSNALHNRDYKNGFPNTNPNNINRNQDHAYEKVKGGSSSAQHQYGGRNYDLKNIYQNYPILNSDKYNSGIESSYSYENYQPEQSLNFQNINQSHFSRDYNDRFKVSYEQHQNKTEHMTTHMVGGRSVPKALESMSTRHVTKKEKHTNFNSTRASGNLGVLFEKLPPHETFSMRYSPGGEEYEEINDGEDFVVVGGKYSTENSGKNSRVYYERNRETGTDSDIYR